MSTELLKKRGRPKKAIAEEVVVVTKQPNAKPRPTRTRRKPAPALDEVVDVSSAGKGSARRQISSTEKSSIAKNVARSKDPSTSKNGAKTVGDDIPATDLGSDIIHQATAFDHIEPGQPIQAEIKVATARDTEKPPELEDVVVTEDFELKLDQTLRTSSASQIEALGPRKSPVEANTVASSASSSAAPKACPVNAEITESILKVLQPLTTVVKKTEAAETISTVSNITVARDTNPTDSNTLSDAAVAVLNPDLPQVITTTSVRKEAAEPDSTPTNITSAEANPPAEPPHLLIPATHSSLDTDSVVEPSTAPLSEVSRSLGDSTPSTPSTILVAEILKVEAPTGTGTAEQVSSTTHATTAEGVISAPSSPILEALELSTPSLIPTAESTASAPATEPQSTTASSMPPHTTSPPIKAAQTASRPRQPPLHPSWSAKSSKPTLPKALPPLRPVPIPSPPRLTELPYTELKKNALYKSKSRRVTALMVSIPIMLVTSKVIYDRLSRADMNPNIQRKIPPNLTGNHV